MNTQDLMNELSNELALVNIQAEPFTETTTIHFSDTALKLVRQIMGIKNVVKRLAMQLKKELFPNGVLNDKGEEASEDDVLNGDEFETFRKDLRTVLVWSLSRNPATSNYGQRLISDFDLEHFGKVKVLNQFIKDHKLKAGYTAEEFDDIQTELEKDRVRCVAHTTGSVRSIIKYWDLPGADQRRKEDAARHQTPIKITTEADFNASWQSLSTRTTSISPSLETGEAETGGVNLEGAFSPLPEQPQHVCTICTEIISDYIMFLPCMHPLHEYCALKYVKHQKSLDEPTKCPTCSLEFNPAHLCLAEEDVVVQNIHPEDSDSEPEWSGDEEDSADEEEDDEDEATVPLTEETKLDDNAPTVPLPAAAVLYETLPKTIDILFESAAEFLAKFKTIFECCNGKGAISNYMKNKDFTVHCSDKYRGENRLDFLNEEPSFDYDCIITNPPYSTVHSFITRAMELQKPFAQLIPIYSLGCKDMRTHGKTHAFKFISCGRHQFRQEDGTLMNPNYGVGWLIYDPEDQHKEKGVHIVYP
jgi:hypothetical protein